MAKYTPSLSQTSRPFCPPVKRRWAAAQGGNRLTRLHSLLVGDQRVAEILPPDDPRRTPSARSSVLPTGLEPAMAVSLPPFTVVAS
jgi:hypothetical protein